MISDSYNAESVNRDLGTGIIGSKVFYHESLPSTMDAALELANADAGDGTVVIAGCQTGGRGRLRRSWQAPSGNIALSVLLYPEAAALPYLVMLAALAVVRTINKVTGLEAGIKWPNDVLINGRKVCGILSESRSISGRRCAVIGVGVNVEIDLAAYPDIAATATGLTQASGRPVSRLSVVRGVLQELDSYYASLPEKGGQIFEAWRRSLVTLGQRVTVSSATETLEGTAEDVGESGALLLRLDDGGLREILAGDVKLRHA